MVAEVIKVYSQTKYDSESQEAKRILNLRVDIFQDAQLEKILEISIINIKSLTSIVGTNPPSGWLPACLVRFLLTRT